MVSAPATHASPAPLASSLASKSAEVEPGFQAALNSSQGAAKTSEGTASTAAARTNAERKVPNGPERGRTEKKRNLAGSAGSFQDGETAATTPGDCSTDGLTTLSGGLVLSISQPPLAASASGLATPASIPEPSKTDPQVPDSQAIAAAISQGTTPLATGTASALGAQSAGPVALATMRSSAVHASQGGALSAVIDGQAAAPPSAKELEAQATPPSGQNFSDQPGVRPSATAPNPGTGSIAPGSGSIPSHAMDAVVAPAPVPHGLYPGPANAGIPTPQASVPVDAHGNGTGKENAGAGSESAGNTARPAGDKNLNLPSSSATPFSVEGIVAASAPVHAVAGVESVNSALNVSVAPPSAQLAPATSNPSAGGAAGTFATPATNAGTESQPINTARVLQSMNGTEMRVGMHSQEFGSISIATSVTPGGVAAQIALDHGALSRALASHLPSIEDKLGSALGVPARVELRDGSGHSSQGSQGSDANAPGSGAYGGGGSQRGTPGREAAGSASQRSAETAYAIAVPEETALKTAANGRLSVQA